MGAAETADTAKIRDFAFINDTNRRTQKGNHHVDCNYMMLVENLMNLDHAMFLHRQTGGLTDPSLTDNKVDQTNDEVRDLRLHHAKPPLFFAPYLNSNDNVDIWTDIRWNAPSLILNSVGCFPAGTSRISGGMSTLGAHFLMPETQHTTCGEINSKEASPCVKVRKLAALAGKAGWCSPSGLLLTPRVAPGST